MVDISIIIVSLKFILPVFMIPFPFQAVWLNYFLDTIDGDLLQFFGMTDASYQLVDKLADFVSYIFMVIAGRKWPIRNTLIALFAYRSVGQILFFLSGDERYFFAFQNFLEPLIILYTLILLKEKSHMKTFAFYQKHLNMIWGIIIAYKIWNEWYLHIANIDLSTLFLGING